MAAQAATEIRKYTVQEYLDLERDAKEKSEYYDGYIVAMAGAQPPHNIIRANLLIRIGIHISGKGCTPYPSDQRVRIKENNTYVYPDITIVCGQDPEYNDDNPRALLNPTLVVEVLSPSTKDWDQRNKLEYYQEHSTLQEVLFVDSVRPYIGGFFKRDGRWEKTSSIYQLHSNYRLESIGLDLKLSEVYGSLLDEFGPINPVTLRR